MPAVVVAAGLVKRWGATTALAGATLSIGPGVTGLLGANGAGKTTLLGLVLGLHRPDEGTIEVLGLDPDTAGPEVRARVGYAPEHDALPPDVRAHDLVRHLAEVHGLPQREARGPGQRRPLAGRAWARSGSGPSAPCPPASASG